LFDVVIVQPTSSFATLYLVDGPPEGVGHTIWLDSDPDSEDAIAAREVLIVLYEDRLALATDA
jgi:hypothetical protein